MTMRERIADWITSGALTRARHDARQGWADGYRHRIDAEWCRDQYKDKARMAHMLQERLNRIAACETPSANGTVRRMARIAREALE